MSRPHQEVAEVTQATVERSRKAGCTWTDVPGRSNKRKGGFTGQMCFLVGPVSPGILEEVRMTSEC